MNAIARAESVDVFDSAVFESYATARRLLASRQDATPDVLALAARLEEKLGAVTQACSVGQAGGAALATAKWQIWSALSALVRSFDLGPSAHGAVGRLLTQCSRYELLPDSRFKITQDWFSRNVSHWERVLAPLRGRERLVGLEIGVFEGLSTCWLLENVLQHETSRIVCIDPFDAGGHPHAETHFDHNVEAVGAAHKVTKLKGYSQQVLPLLAGNRYDVAYIDGSHHPRDTLQDALSVWPLLRPGAILIFDDYGIGRSYPREIAAAIDPSPGIDAFLGFTAGEYELLHKDWQLIVRRT